MTKCIGGNHPLSIDGTPNSKMTKTEELLDFLRMNDRILRFKKRTARNIEELTLQQKQMAAGVPSTLQNGSTKDGT